VVAVLLFAAGDDKGRPLSATLHRLPPYSSPVECIEKR